MSGPPRILHIQGSFDLGGKEARIVRLMNLWGPRLHHSMLVANPAMMGARAAIDAGVPVEFPIDAPPIGGRPSPRRLFALARYMAGFDLVLTYNWGAMNAVLAQRLFRRVLRLPGLVHHEDGFNADEAQRLNPRRNLFRRVALSGAQALVVPSCVLEHIAIQSWRVPVGKVHNIPNGIDVAAYAVPPRADAIAGLDRSDGRLVVGSLAGLRPVKNLRRLVRAVAPLGSRVRLVIVGEGPEKAALAQEAARLGVDLLLPGFLARPQDYIGLFDIFALTSDSEQFPISLVEAMAAGLPVVATDVGDVRSMLTPTNRHFVFPVVDEAGLARGLAELVDNADLRARLGAANRCRAHDAFEERAMVSRYAEVYGHAARRCLFTD